MMRDRPGARSTSPHACTVAADEIGSNHLGVYKQPYSPCTRITPLWMDQRHKPTTEAAFMRNDSSELV